MKRLRVHLQDRPVAGDAGIGYDDVDAAEMFDGLGGRGLHGGQVTHVGDRGEHVFVAAQSPGQRGQRGFVEIGQHKFGALVAQPLGDLRPDSPGATGDENDFVLHFVWQPAVTDSTPSSASIAVAINLGVAAS